MNDETTIATLRAAFHAGATIQAWHLNEGATTSADGRWDDLSCEGEPAFGCPVHLYRIAPDDAARMAKVGYMPNMSRNSQGGAP